MLNFKRVVARSMPILLVLMGFIGGMIVNQITRTAQAQEGGDGGSTVNQVLEMTRLVTKDSPVLVMDTPGGTAQIDRLLWGDRVLWRGQEANDPATNERWIRVYLSEGVAGWIRMTADDQASGKLIQLSPQHFTTVGIDVGVAITVTDSGAGANLRDVPSVKGNIVQKLVAGEVYAVTEGPYQSEYYIWWKLTNTTTGVSGWMVDVGGWLTVNPAVQVQPTQAVQPTLEPQATADLSGRDDTGNDSKDDSQ